MSLLVDVFMISLDSFPQSIMDWEPAESYCMDVDEKGLVEAPSYQELFSSDVCMAPTTIEEVDMASPMLISQPQNLPLPIIKTDSNTFFLPPLELNLKPIVFPPLNIHAFSRQTLERLVDPSEMKPVPLHLSFDIHMPAVLTCQPESSPMEGVTYASSVLDLGLDRAVTFPSTEPSGVVGVNVPEIPRYVPAMPRFHPGYLSSSKIAIMDQDSRPWSSTSDCRPISKSRTTLQGVSPIATPVTPIYSLEPLLDVHEIGDARTEKGPSTSSTGWPDSPSGNDISPNDQESFIESTTPPGWPDWIVEQDVRPSTPHLVVITEAKTPGWSNWTVDEDTTPISQCSILETTALCHYPQTTILHEYVDCGVDLIGLSIPNSDSSNSSEDDSVLRAFGGSNLEDLDWILEGFRATNVLDTYVEPYDWAPVSEAGPDLISLDSTHDLRYGSVQTSLALSTTHNGSFELPSFKFADGIQTRSNELFRTSTPAPCDRSVFEEPLLVAGPSLDNMASCSSPEIVIDTYDSGSFLSPVSEILDASDMRNVLRNVKAFKINLSIKPQKVPVKTTKKDASTQTDNIPDAHHRLRPQRRYSPYARYSPYQKPNRDFTLHSNDSVDLEYTQLIQESHDPITSGTSCSLSSPVDDDFLGSSNSIQGSIISEHESASDLADCVNSREPEADQEKETSFPGTFPIDHALDDVENTKYLQKKPHRIVTSGTFCSLPAPKHYLETERTFPGAYPIERVVYALDDLESTRYFQEQSYCTVTSGSSCGLPSPEGDREENKFPGAYPIEQVVYALDESAERPAEHVVKVAQNFQGEFSPYPTAHSSAQCRFKESFFKFIAYLFDW